MASCSPSPAFEKWESPPRGKRRASWINLKSDGGSMPEIADIRKFLRGGGVNR